MAKILVISHYTRSLLNFRGELIKTLVRRGHEVFAFGPEKGFEKEIAKLGASFVPIRLQRSSVNPLEDFMTFRELLTLIRNIRPDVVFSYAIKPVIYGSLAAGIAKVPRIYSLITGLGYTFVNESIKQKLLNKGVVFLYRLALRYNQVVFFQNRDDLELFKALRILNNRVEAVVVNGSGVDLQRFYPAPPVCSPLSFILVARLIKDKGIIEYAEAARIVKKRYPEVVFRLLGPFDENPNGLSKEVIARWVDEGIIEYLGETNDVRPFLASSSVFVLPSTYREGVPRSALEAMAMGRPIITTDVPGCRETVVHERNGLLIPPKDVNALVEAMEFFVLHPESIEPMGLESRKIAEKKFDVHKVNQIMIEKMGL